MANYECAKASYLFPAITPDELCDTTVEETYEFKAPSLPAVNDIIRFLKLPSLGVVKNAKIISDKLDTGEPPAVLINVGFYDETAGTVGSELFSAAGVAQTGGVMEMNSPNAYRIAPTAHDRIVAAKIAMAPAGAVPGKLTLQITYSNR